MTTTNNTDNNKNTDLNTNPESQTQNSREQNTQTSNQPNHKTTNQAGNQGSNQANSQPSDKAQSGSDVTAKSHLSSKQESSAKTESNVAVKEDQTINKEQSTKENRSVKENQSIKEEPRTKDTKQTVSAQQIKNKAKPENKIQASNQGEQTNRAPRKQTQYSNPASRTVRSINSDKALKHSTAKLKRKLAIPAKLKRKVKLKKQPKMTGDIYDDYSQLLDAEAAKEIISSTMAVYDPDAERIEDFEHSGINEIINCCVYSRKTGEFVEKIGLDSVSRTLANKSHFIWLGLYDPSIETVQTVQKAFDIHELALEDAFNENQRAKIENYGNNSIFVVVRTAFLSNNQIHYGTTSMFMGNNYIITIRTGASNSYAPVRAYCHRRPEKMAMGPVFVLHAVLDYVVDSYLPITDSLGEYLREQERNIFSYTFSQDTLKSLYKLKSQLVHMRAVMLPVQDVCNFFINHKKDDLVSTFPNAAKPYFRDVNDHLLRALDAVNGLNEMLSVAMDTYLAVVNMGQNEVVRKLAAWAGILAVPTAVAGIYGMNFDFMPELHYEYAYFVILGAIFTTCLILYYQFKKSGWL